MKIFHCSHCQHLVFFENVQCVHCGYQLAYSPSEREMIAVGAPLAAAPSNDSAQASDALQDVAPPDVQPSAVEPQETRPAAPQSALADFPTEVQPDGPLSGEPGPASEGHAEPLTGDQSTQQPEPLRAPRLCQNYVEHEVCNWSVDPGDDHPLCISCRLTRVIPPLDHPGIVGLWRRAESAKRRLVVNLMALGLPVQDSGPDRGDGIRFEFKEPQPGEAVLTGHHEGTITLNLLEADDVLRERLRAQFEEPYRTVLGHLRHESGHYYWDKLLRDTPRLSAFRQVFGDESRDYQDALMHHYQNGPRDDWAGGYISAYASVHPWEDWAETWAHYLHMVDTLETARACGLTLRPRRTDEPALVPTALGEDMMRTSFDTLTGSWFPVTYLLNNLSRGLGLADAYPFVLNPVVIEKLRFVHDTIALARSAPQQDPQLEAA